MFGLLLSNWKIVVIGLLTAALLASGAYIGLLKSKNQTLVDQKAAISAALEISQESVRGLRASIDEQNAAIQALKSASIARIEASRKEIERARAEANAARKRATDIMNIKRPQGVSACDAANSLFNREIEDAK